MKDNLRPSCVVPNQSCSTASGSVAGLCLNDGGDGSHQPKRRLTHKRFTPAPTATMSTFFGSVTNL